MTIEKTPELKLLADYVAYPKETRECIARFLITDDSFAKESYREIFRLFEADKDPTPGSLLPLMVEKLGFDPKSSKDQNDLLNDYTDPVPSYIPGTAHEVAKQHYCRQLREAVILATNDCSDCADGEALQYKVKSVIDAIPPPPKLGENTTEAELAKQYLDKNLKDIPDGYLHVPGFIDKVVDYSLKSAYNPNRTLAFAGALALTAHLAGRRYRDRRNTRTNLYIFGLGPSGIGKGHPRDINRQIMRSINPRLAGTVFDKTGSGEAIETTLGKRPRALFQLDEFQKELRKMNDTRNPNGSSIVEYLLMLYSESGHDHTMRVKATDPDSIGRVICDPSLTLFATGIAKDTFQTFTPALIKEGLLGRCLMFDSEIVGNPNTFGDAGILEMPSDIVEDAKFINNAAGGSEQDSLDNSNPKVVNYDTGVGDHLDAIFKDANQRRAACQKNDDDFGAALWARASEKVSKLALVSAISRDPVNTLICQQDVTWAWKLVEFLVARMLQRIDTYMASDKVEWIIQELLAFLAREGGVSTQHEFLRRKQKTILDVGPHSDFQKAVTALVNCGRIERKELGKGSIRLRLVK